MYTLLFCINITHEEDDWCHSFMHRVYMSDSRSSLHSSAGSTGGWGQGKTLTSAIIFMSASSMWYLAINWARLPLPASTGQKHFMITHCSNSTSLPPAPGRPSCNVASTGDVRKKSLWECVALRGAEVVSLRLSVCPK